jgi:hypothetical protein
LSVIAIAAISRTGALLVAGVMIQRHSGT